MQNKIPYGPKYFLSALGAGGIAVTFFMYLQFLTKHTTPMATFDTILPYLTQGFTLPAILIWIALIGILYFGILHIRLVIWNIGHYGRYKKSEAYEQIKTTNDEVDLMGFPLILAMMLNVLLILFGVFIPGLWNIIEYIFPLAIIGFLGTGIFALTTYIPFLTRSMTQGFDFEKNNKLGQLKASLTFLMVAVGLAAPVTMSQTFATAGVSLILSLFFLLIGMFFFALHTLWGMQGIMKHGIAFESSSSFWVPIPIFTLMGVTIVRYMLGMTRVFDMSLPPISFLIILTIFIAGQILFGVVGYVMMKQSGYFQTYLSGKEKSLNTFALVCPGVAGVVLGFFFVHQGLIRFGLFELFSPTHYIFLGLLLVLQILTIKTFYRIKNILL